MTKEQLVQDWMTSDVITVAPDTPLVDAHKLMMDFGIRRLPVMKRGKLVGIITRGDVRGAQASEATTLSVWELNYLLSKLTVGGVMRREVITAEPGMSVREAARLMLEHKIAGLPVLSGEELVGIITESDIFRMLVESWEAEGAMPAVA